MGELLLILLGTAIIGLMLYWKRVLRVTEVLWLGVVDARRVWAGEQSVLLTAQSQAGQPQSDMTASSNGSPQGISSAGTSSLVIEPGEPHLSDATKAPALSTAPVITIDTMPYKLTTWSASVVAGAAQAMSTPPSFEETYTWMMADAHEQRIPTNSALFPLGWKLRRTTSGTYVPDLVYTDLVRDCYNLAVIGQQRYGKTWAFLMGLVGLTRQLLPSQMQWVIFDFKKIEFPFLKDSVYMQRLVEPTSDSISAACRWLQQEMESRATVLREHHILDWQHYTGDDMPMLIVYISELSSLEVVLGTRPMNQMLDALLGRGAAYGIRVVIDAHQLSNLSTDWRTKVSLVMAGALKRHGQQDAVNTDMSTEDIAAYGAVPPSQLVRGVRGVFTVVGKEQAATIRVPQTFTQQDFFAWVESLPRRQEPTSNINAHPVAEQQEEAVPVITFKILREQGKTVAQCFEHPSIEAQVVALAKQLLDSQGKINNTEILGQICNDLPNPGTSGTRSQYVTAILKKYQLIENPAEKVQQQAAMAA